MLSSKSSFFRHRKLAQKNKSSTSQQHVGRKRKLPAASELETTVVDSSKNEYCHASQSLVAAKYAVSQSTISRTLGKRQKELGKKPVRVRKICKVTHEYNLPRILDMQQGFLEFYEGIANSEQCVYDETKIKYGPGQHQAHIRARAGDSSKPTEQPYRFSNATLTLAVVEGQIVKAHLKSSPGTHAAI